MKLTIPVTSTQGFFPCVELVSFSPKYTGSGSGSHPWCSHGVGGDQGTDALFGLVNKEFFVKEIRLVSEILQGIFLISICLV